MWLSPDCPLHFKFVGSRAPALNGEWLDRLLASASSGSGLIVTDERGALARASGQHQVGRHH